MPPEGPSSRLVLVEPAGAVAPIAFQYPENAKYHRYGGARAALTDDEDDESSDSDQTTDTFDPNVSADDHLALSFDPGPKDLSKGYVFGSDPPTCDVLLAKDKTSGISGNHFSINVDWDSGNPIIMSLTSDEKTGIRVFSDLDHIWKLHLKGANVVMGPGTTTHLEITHRMKLVIHNPHRESRNYQYNKDLQDYLKKCKNAVPDMSHMRLYDPEQTPLMISRTRGLTGREYVTTTSNVGKEVVLCQARGHQNWAGGSRTFIVKRFRNTSEKWKKHARTKLSMLRALRQRNIIAPEDIISDGTEYMPVYLPEPQETLVDRLASRGHLQEGLAGLVLVQVFEGLKFLHENGMIHGGLYPGSIRFEHPSTPWNVQLSDIGLYPYVELDNQEERQLYATQKLTTRNPLPVWDTWSAGVVGLLLLSPDGLPTRKRLHTQPKWTTIVANLAVEIHDEQPQNKASRFITNVLKVECSERLSAEECLQDPWLREIKDDEEIHESTEIEETTETEDFSGEDTETEELQSSQSKGKQPLHARRASSGNRSRQLSRTPISKGKQQQPQHSRRTSSGTSSHQLRQRSMTPQDNPSSPSTFMGSRHTTTERSITPQSIPYSPGTLIGSRRTTLERSLGPEYDNNMRGFK